MTDRLLPVVLCGGSGTRLWPLSRELHPKQFHALIGERSMLQETILRLQGLESHVPMMENPMLVCNVEHRFLAANQMLEAGVSASRILLEPEGRNTAPALTLAAIQSQADDLDPIMVVMPADHLITDVSAFHQAVQNAIAVAREGGIAVFGVTANRPETGYGYLQCSMDEDAEGGARSVRRFVEKPDLPHAQQYVDSGDYLWNSGLFVLRASVWLTALRACRPDILEACELSMQNAVHDMDFVRPDKPAYLGCPSDSIDYAVMEQLPQLPELGIQIKAIPLDAGWSDLGSWDAIWSVLKVGDADGNALSGNAIELDCERSLLVSTGRLIAGIGLNHIAVIETPDAVLAVDLRSTQNIKQIISELQMNSDAVTHAHRKVHRPWGWYDSVDQGDRFKVKRIVVNPGASLSMQMHHHRAEHWIVVRGTAEVTNGEKVFLLSENESTFIPLGNKHRLRNPGKIPLEIIEVQSGGYLDENDIVRFESSY